MATLGGRQISPAWYERDIKREPTLSFKEWVCKVKQLGLMHILYWMIKDVHKAYYKAGIKSIGLSNYHIAQQFYYLSNTESKLVDYLDSWEKKYKRTILYNKHKEQC